MNVIFDWNLGNMIYHGLITLRLCGFPFAEIRSFHRPPERWREAAVLEHGRGGQVERFARLPGSTSEPIRNRTDSIAYSPDRTARGLTGDVALSVSPLLAQD